MTIGKIQFIGKCSNGICYAPDAIFAPKLISAERIEVFKKTKEEKKAERQIKKEEKDKLLTEDDRKSLDDKVQKLTDDLIKEIDGLLAAKEKEILAV